jgi:hypothetical protein
LTGDESSDDEDRADAFIEEAARALAFLSARHGFDSPSTEFNRRAHTLTVAFTKGSVAIEAKHDLREGDVQVKIARLENGRRPAGFHVDREGRRCRAGVIEILMKRGVRGFGLKPAKKDETAKERFNRLLSRYGRLLEEHAADVLAGSADALEEL